MVLSELQLRPRIRNVRRGLIAASALAVSIMTLLAMPASGAAPTWKTDGPITVGIRCSFNPCRVSGGGFLRAVGVRLPPKTGGKGKADPEHALDLQRHDRSRRG